MQIQVAEQRILLLKDKVDAEAAKELAWKSKLDAFGTLSKVTSFLSRPKDEDFSVIYSEHRFEPFWRVVAKARYEYTRGVNYTVPVRGTEVKSVTLHETKYESKNGAISVPVVEYCLQEELEDKIIDGLTNAHAPQLRTYISMTPHEIRGQLKDEVSESDIIVPPQARISAIMRDSLAKMIKGIQADTILDEQVEVTHVDLYYRPIYAYKFSWISKQKEAILEVNGLTGECAAGSRIFSEYFGKVLNQDFLFDIGADAAGILIPGGSIAVKAAKRYLDGHSS